MRALAKLGLGAVAFWLLVTSAFAAPAYAAPAPAVGVTAVTTQNIAPGFSNIGHVIAIQSVKIVARVTATIDAVNFQQGSTVTAGQLLFSGIVRQDRARLVAADLMRPHFFTGWGIRTVAQGEARYNPMSYHNGSIWPHDNALIALGLARYGLKHSVECVFKGLFDAATYMDLRRLPELFCGFRREKERGPTLYPVACAPQAWASATPFTLLEASLGLEFDAGRGEIRLRNPRLPAFLDEVVLRDLRLGPSSVDLRVRRHGDEVSLEVLRTRGQIQVSMVLVH